MTVYTVNLVEFRLVNVIVEYGAYETATEGWFKFVITQSQQKPSNLVPYGGLIVLDGDSVVIRMIGIFFKLQEFRVTDDNWACLWIRYV